MSQYQADFKISLRVSEKLRLEHNLPLRFILPPAFSLPRASNLPPAFSLPTPTHLSHQFVLLTMVQSWSQAHERGNFAILRTLLAEDGCLKLDIDRDAPKITARIDRTKIVTHGREAIGKLLLQLHVWRCTADITAARATYETLTTVTEEWLEIRKIMCHVIRARSGAWVFANTFIDADGKVELKEYPATLEGIVQSWAERFP